LHGAAPMQHEGRATVRHRATAAARDRASFRRCRVAPLCAMAPEFSLRSQRKGRRFEPCPLLPHASPSAGRPERPIDRRRVGCRHRWLKRPREPGRLLSAGTCVQVAPGGRQGAVAHRVSRRQQIGPVAPLRHTSPPRCQRRVPQPRRTFPLVRLRVTAEPTRWAGFLTLTHRDFRDGAQAPGLLGAHCRSLVAVSMRQERSRAVPSGSRLDRVLARAPSHGRGSLHTGRFGACAPNLPVTVVEIVAYPNDVRP
jgi:hypothetical protein